jgi:hypothetical protein
MQCTVSSGNSLDMIAQRPPCQNAVRHLRRSLVDSQSTPAPCFPLLSGPNMVQLRHYSIHNWDPYNLANLSLGRFPDCKWFTSIVRPLYSIPCETSPRSRCVPSNCRGRPRDSTQICRCRTPSEFWKCSGASFGKRVKGSRLYLLS